MQNPEWEEKAEHNGLYAVACAILELADRIDSLGFNDKNPAEPPGTTEKIAITLEEFKNHVGGLESYFGDLVFYITENGIGRK